MTTKEGLQKRTKRYALRIIKLTQAIPISREGRTIANQLIRSGTSVGANYRAACRARSKAEFAAKLGIVIEEADESLFWLELLVESNIMSEVQLKKIMIETNELVAIMVSSRKTAIKNHKS